MANKMIGCRIPPEWYSKIEQVKRETGAGDADIVKEALGRYLGAAGGANRTLSRLDKLEQRLIDLEAQWERTSQASQFLRQMGQE